MQEIKRLSKGTKQGTGAFTNQSHMNSLKAFRIYTSSLKNENYHNMNFVAERTPLLTRYGTEKAWFSVSHF